MKNSSYLMKDSVKIQLRYLLIQSLSSKLMKGFSLNFYDHNLCIYLTLFCSFFYLFRFVLLSKTETDQELFFIVISVSTLNIIQCNNIIQRLVKMFMVYYLQLKLVQSKFSQNFSFVHFQLLQLGSCWTLLNVLYGI